LRRQRSRKNDVFPTKQTIAPLLAVLLMSCHASEAPFAGEKPTSAQAERARIESDVRFLADDLLEGREAGTRGYDLAARFVAERYRSLGLEPGGDDASYFQQVPLREVAFGSEFGGELTLEGDDRPDIFVAGEDYMVSPQPDAAQHSVEAPVVFVGYGLVADSHDRDDYAGFDVDGKIVAYLYGAPKFLQSEERAYYRATLPQRASERGAVGTIFLETPEQEAVFPFDAIVRNSSSGSQMYWLDERDQPFSLAPNIEATAYVSLAGAEKLFAKAPRQWASIIEAAEEEAGLVPGFEMDLKARITYKARIRDLTSANVVGVLLGSDPVLRNEYVLLTAHLDGLGVHKTEDEGDDEIQNGAQDNAVGVATVLEVARLMARNPPKRSVLFVALTSEEKGMVGSGYFARNPTVPKRAIVANVNLDNPILVHDFTDVIAYGAERSDLFAIVRSAAERAQVALSPDPEPEQGFFARSDHYSFVKQGVPAIQLTTGWANGGKEAQSAFRKDHYHGPSDEADLVNFDVTERFVQLNFEIANGIANMGTRPLWKAGDFFGTTFDGPMQAQTPIDNQ